VNEVASFLRDHELFSELDEDALERPASRIEVESFAAGDVIFRQGEPGMRDVRLVRSGSVELVEGERVLDLLGEGEWFGHPATLSGLPTGSAAQAHEDTIAYRLAPEDVVSLLARPSGLRFVTRSLLARAGAGDVAQAVAAPPVDLPPRALVREELVICSPDTPIREAARRMADAYASSAGVPLPSGELGILTDRDLRVRVVAGAMPLDAPISAAMTAPAVSADAEMLGSELMIAMIDEGVRHLPVVTAGGEVLGVLTDVDLLVTEARSPLIVRRAIDEARDVDELRRAAGQVIPAIVALHEGSVGAARIGAVQSTLVDALIRRLVGLRTAGELPPFCWMSLGSYGRREPVPWSDVDSALAWEGEPARGARPDGPRRPRRLRYGGRRPRGQRHTSAVRALGERLARHDRRVARAACRGRGPLRGVVAR
jgi:CBS domain-containing protein